MSVIKGFVISDNLNAFQCPRRVFAQHIQGSAALTVHFVRMPIMFYFGQVVPYTSFPLLKMSARSVDEAAGCACL